MKSAFLCAISKIVARTAQSRGIPRYSASFVRSGAGPGAGCTEPDQCPRTAVLTAAGLGQSGASCASNRRQLYCQPFVLCAAVLSRASGARCCLPTKIISGSLMGLALRREALGDILLPPDQPGTAYVFALEPAAQLICQELCSAGRFSLTTQLCPLDQLPSFGAELRELRTATVSSPRLDAVLSAMLRCSRGAAAQLITAGRVNEPPAYHQRPRPGVRGGCVHRARQRAVRACLAAREEQKGPNG